MRARRIRFAAPFVIITTASCGQPAPVQVPTESPIVATATLDAAVTVDAEPSIDAAPPIDAAPSIDAAPASASAAYNVTIALPARMVEPKGYVSCHDFGPANRGCNPPRPIHRDAENLTTEMIDISGRGDGTMILVTQKHDEETEDDLIARGMVVTAHAPSMKTRANVGQVRATTHAWAKLYVGIPLDEVKRGADLVIQADDIKPLPPPEPVIARIVDTQIDGDGTIITIGVGSDDGIDRDWRLEVIDKKNRPVANGRGVVVRLAKNLTIAKVKLTRDQVQHNPRVRLTEPAP
jgi:hypothetical protein